MRIAYAIGLICLPFIANGQLLSEVKIEGLLRTKESYVRQFIRSKAGQRYDSSMAEQDRQRLANLEIMQSVTLERRDSASGIVLHFGCKEMINTIPIFGLGQTRETFWYRAGIQNANLTHQGDKLVAYYQYYDRHSTFISYVMPRIQNRAVGFSGTLIRWSTLEPLTINQTVIDYKYDNLTIGLASVINLSFRESIESGFQSFRETYAKKNTNLEPNAPDNLLRKGMLLKTIFRSNHINFSSFYQQGFSTQLNVELIKRQKDVTMFFIAFNDFKYFHRLGKTGNLAVRLRLGLSTNEATPFAPFVLDSFLNIRGVGNRVDRGTGSAVLNAEYRQTLFDKKIIAAQAVVFTDFGSWRKPGGTFSDFRQTGNMKAFSGLGLRLIYKRAFDTLLRIDYGFDYSHTSGLVLGIGQYF